MTATYSITKNGQNTVDKIVEMGREAALFAAQAFRLSAQQYAWSAKREGTFTGGALYDRSLWLSYTSARLSALSEAVSAKCLDLEVAA